MANWKFSNEGQKLFEEKLESIGWSSLSDSQLADLFDLDRSVVSNLRNGQQQGRKKTLEIAMIALGENADKVKSEVFAKKYFQEIKNALTSRSQRGLESPTIQNDLEQTLTIGNPFLPLNGRIENPEQFFNREKELSDIFDFLNASSGVELLGDRQIGKSSVLIQVQKYAAVALKIKREAIYFDLNEVQTEEVFYEVLCEKLGIPTCMGYGFSKAVREKRVLLLLDKVEKMILDQGFTRQLGEQLRSLAEGDNPPLRLVVASRTPLDQLFLSHTNGRTSPFQGICVRVDLLPWDEITLQKFVTTRLEQTGIHFSETQIEKLWQESQGHPQKLMKACFDLYRQYCSNL